MAWRWWRRSESERNEERKGAPSPGVLVLVGLGRLVSEEGDGQRGLQTFAELLPDIAKAQQEAMQQCEAWGALAVALGSENAVKAHVF